jgi:bacillithiol biosynthesis cysteine-adding enzyme BshC
MLTFVDTPLAARSTEPARRAGGWNPALDPALIAPPAEARAKLARPDVLVVTSGQQPGLFTGPLYTVHKALSARALALALEARWSRPVVPVFWVAADDHDYAEAATVHWLAADGSLIEGALPPRAPDAPLTPLYREPLPPEVSELLDRLETSLPAGPPRDATLAWLRRHYRAGATIGAATGAALAELLGGLGIACLDAAHPAVKTAALPLMRAALDRAAELDRILAARAETLDREGRPAEVKVGDGASLVFLEGAAGRDRLMPDGDGWRTRRSGEPVGRADLDRIATEAPGRLSPNVLLRPVVESAILPTVAYLAGPGELRYLALAEALYPPLGVHRQQPAPRWSGLVVEPRVTRTLEKFELTLEDLAGPPEPLDARIARSLAPADFEPAFAALRDSLAAGFDRVAAVARQIDPTLDKPAQNARTGALSGVADLEKRLLQAQKRRQGELLGQIERARAAISPLGKPQERILSAPGLVGRYGFEVIHELADHVTGWVAAALEGPARPA